MSSNTTTHLVALILEPCFGERLRDLVRDYHCWVVESEQNQPVIREIWNSQIGSNEDPMGPGISTFESVAEATPEEESIRMLDILEDHHGEYAHDPPWSELLICGVSGTEKLERALREFGFVRFQSDAGGRRCFRA